MRLEKIMKRLESTDGKKGATWDSDAADQEISSLLSCLSDL